MAKKKSGPKMTNEGAQRTSQARLELPAQEMDRIRRIARRHGLSLSAFIRLAVINAADDFERRSGK